MSRLALLALLLAGCSDAIQAGGTDVDAGPEDDPLVFEDEPAAGTLEHIHRSIIQPSCAGQPGLCHAGQFEPSMATPAAFYAALVNRPGLEHPDQLRVTPGDAADSLLVDKLRGRNVGTQMPLGAEPLSEAAIAEIEAWIDDGALRAPGAAAPVRLNELPADPEVGIFDSAGGRLDGSGTATVSVGQALTLRQSVQDFETADEDIPVAAFIIVTGDGQNVIVRPGMDDPQVGFASFDASAPMGLGDTLDWRFDWTVPATASLRDDDTGVITPDVPLAGKVLSVVALYIDEVGPKGMATLGFLLNAVEVQP